MPVLDDLGYPNRFGDPHFGLYQPVLDCFLLTLCDSRQAREVKLLASARYSLFVIDLTTAQNYTPNIIDNDCCHHWSLTNRDHVHVGQSDANRIITAHQLEPISNIDPDVGKEQQYLQIVWYYVKYFEKLEILANKQIHDWIDGVLDTEFSDPDYAIVKKCIKDIRYALWCGHDLNQIEKDIYLARQTLRPYFCSDDSLH